MLLGRQPKILVLRGGALGDFICTLPAVAALRRTWPRARIEWMGYPRIACLALEGGLVDAVVSLDRAETAQYFAREPRVEAAQAQWIRSFDAVISYLHDPDGIVRRNLLAFGAKRLVCCSPLVTDGHAVDHLFRAVAELGIVARGGEVPRLTLGAERLQRGRERIRGLGRRVVAIHPGSGAPRKNWPLERFVSLADALRRTRQAQPLFLAGEADDAIVRELAARGSVVPLIRGLDLPEVAGVLAACVGYVGNDSGITHLAAALDLPVTAIFGPTDPALWGPRGKNVLIVAADARKGETLASIPVERVLGAVGEG